VKGRAALAALLLSAHAPAQEAPVRAPFFTTPPEVVARMLALAGTRAEDFVVDLGAGDGRIVIHAARTHGARGLGVDLDPGLVARARDNAERAGVAGRVRFEVQDVMRAELAQASVVTIYLVPYLMQRLEPRLLEALRPGARVVSHAFAFPSWPHDRAETVRLEQPHPTQGDASRLYLYVVPAQARGAWRAPGGWRLRVQQNFQHIEVEASRDGRALAVATARLCGADIEIAGDGFAFRGQVAGDRMAGEMRVEGAPHALGFERVP
jgi:SAM-dependent methyltransferase